MSLFSHKFSKCRWTNNNKSIIFIFKHMNWGEIGPGEWESTEWRIYNNLNVEIFKSYKQGENNRRHRIFIDKYNYKKIVHNINKIKNNNDINVSAYDGSVWEVTQYKNKNEIWKRKAGYIYGIKEFEEITDILNNLIDDRLYKKTRM